MTSWSKPIPESLASSLLETERALLDPVTRSSPDSSRMLIHDDFLEFGSSGSRYDKNSVTSAMQRGGSGSVVIREFEALELAAGAVLCTYRSIGPSGRETRRSSLWVREAGEWQIIFHQGTRIPATWTD